MKEAEWEREWVRRIEENAERVRKGEFGKVKKEWLDFDGWLDGVRVPHFKIENGDILKADESGIWKESESGGWVNLLVFNSSKLTQSRLSGGSKKPYERERSANSLDGWRVELPQEKKVRHNVRGNNFNNTGIRRDRTALIGFGRKHFGHSVGPVGNLHTGKEYFQRSKKGMERERKEITIKSFFDEAEKELGNNCSVERRGETILIKREL